MEQQPRQKHRINIPKYTLGEELISAISHGVGALLGITAMVLCIVKSVGPQGDGYKLASSIVFGLTVTLLYLMSCLYHSLKVNKAKRVFRVIDHCTIFLLIAGTYTPYTLVSLRDSIGWWIFGIIWGVAIVGISLNAACYLLMGWMIVLAYQRMTVALEPAGLSLLVWGGVAYTVGAVLYGIGARKKYFHSVFHFFCLAGTVLHFFSIYCYVL